MEKDAKLINHLLLESPNSSEALATLNRLQKSRHARWSMQYVCKKIGIPSTGYFSDVLKGKRRLHPKYLKATQKAFALNDLQSQYFECLVMRDQDTETTSNADWDERLAKIASQMQVEYIPIPLQLSEGLLFHILVLSSFSLFGHDPSLKDLESYFGRALHLPLHSSLHKLKSMGLVEESGATYSLAKTRIIFQDAEDGFSHLEFLEKSITHAASQVKTWFKQPDKSIFLSTVVTVNEKDFEAKLPDIRSRIHAILNDLNVPQGDQLLELNLQLFPFDPKAFKE